MKKECKFCKLKVRDIDYRNPELLKRYLGAWGKILPKERTALCSNHQRKLTRAIKRARHLALLPFTLH